MRSCFLSNTHCIKVMLVIKDDVVHGLIIILTTNNISVKYLHGGTKTRNSIGWSVILGGFQVTNKDIVCRRLVLLNWCHPPPKWNLEGQGLIFFNIFWMAQQINIQIFTCFSIIVVPIESIKKKKKKKKGESFGMWHATINWFTINCFKGRKQKTFTCFRVLN